MRLESMRLSTVTGSDVKNRSDLPQKIVLLESGDFQIRRQALQGEAGVIGLQACDDSFPIAPSRESRLQRLPVKPVVVFPASVE